MKRARSILGGVLVAAVFVLAGIMLVPALLGFDRYVVLTGSMTGTYDPGSMIFNKPVAATDLKVGDVITYVPPASSGYGRRPITHRIHDIGHDARGRLSIQTKGDANGVADTWRFVPKPNVSRVEGSLPYVGHVYSELNTRRGRLLAFTLPALLIALSVFVKVWRDAGDEMRRREGLPAREPAEPRQPKRKRKREPVVGTSL